MLLENDLTAILKEGAFVRLLSYLKGGRPFIGVRVGGQVAEIDNCDMVAFLQTEDYLKRAQDAADRGASGIGLVEPDRLLAPVPRPGKILNVELNYPSLLEYEPDDEMPTRPRYFAKLPSAVIGPGDPIKVPREELKVDYEVELALIIGRRAHRVTADDAWPYILGYTVLNDVAARDVQLEQNNTLFGKGIDTFCPLGPDIVLCDEIADPSILGVRSYVNGKLRQNDSTANLHFKIPEVIEDVTATVTLEPGDIVSTGTPAGTGLNQDPPSFLRPGDEVCVEIDKIGRLVNRVEADWL